MLMNSHAMRKLILLAGLLFTAEAVCFSQTQKLQSTVLSYFQNYPFSCSARGETIKIENFKVLTDQREIRIFLNETFGVQHLTKESVELIYHDLAKLMPPDYKGYNIRVFTK